MKTRISKMIATMVILGLFMIQTPITMAGELGASNNKTNAKVARIKAKQRALARKNRNEDRAARRNSDGCGNVSIGNVVNEKGAQATRNVTVVITGDVISTGNKCK